MRCGESSSRSAAWIFEAIRSKIQTLLTRHEVLVVKPLIEKDTHSDGRVRQA
ncbi:MAG: hypothetical protein U0894_10170 [Pirellulales bacterium]